MIFGVLIRFVLELCRRRGMRIPDVSRLRRRQPVLGVGNRVAQAMATSADNYLTRRRDTPDARSSRVPPALRAGRRPAGTRAWVPCLFLLVCTPVVVDLLFGAFTLHTLIALVPTVVTYGLAALLIRGLAPRQGARWSTIVILGVAFSVIAECLIVQTSLAPMSSNSWGRAKGVNWTYLVWAMGYFSVSGIALSIQLTELMLPTHRVKPWLTPRGMGVASVVFVLGAVPTWYNWTQIVAPRLTHQPVYRPSAIILAAAAVVAGGLIVTGRIVARRPPRSRAPLDRLAPHPVHVGITAFLAGGMWFALLLPSVTNGALAHVPPALAIALAVGVGAATATVVRGWSHTRSWGDRHRLALIIGALTASLALGFVANAENLTARSDLLFKVALNVATEAGLLLLACRVRSWVSGEPPAPAVPQRGPLPQGG